VIGIDIDKLRFAIRIIFDKADALQARQRPQHPLDDPGRRAIQPPPVVHPQRHDDPSGKPIQ